MRHIVFLLQVIVVVCVAMPLVFFGLSAELASHCFQSLANWAERKCNSIFNWANL